MANTSKLMHRFNLRPASCANVFTYSIFTVFPVVMFSTILVLKLRSNYLEQIEHLKSNVAKVGLQANSCIAEQERRIKKVHMLETYQKKCRDTLGKASQTLSSLNAAFRLQWERSDNAVAAMNNTQSHYHFIQREVDDKVNLTQALESQNNILKTQVDELHQRLMNVTSSKIDLEGQLGKVKTDLDGLKSNTSRLEGEKKGLEKVLEVKTDAEKEDKIAGTVLKKVLRKKKKTILGALLKKDSAAKEEDDEEDDDDDDDDVSKDDDDKKAKKEDDEDDDEDDDKEAEVSKTKKKTKKKAVKNKKKEKESIEKIVKEHIEKLGLTGNNGTKKAGEAGQQLPPQPQPPYNVVPVPILTPVNMPGGSALGAAGGGKAQQSAPLPPPLPAAAAAASTFFNLTGGSMNPWQQPQQSPPLSAAAAIPAVVLSPTAKAPAPSPTTPTTTAPAEENSSNNTVAPQTQKQTLSP